jgi:myo-inositol catabolism protein IolC
MIENKHLANLGYTKKLCILPFDHRSYFEELLGFHEPLSEEQTSQLSDYKKIVYAAYEKSLTQGVSVNNSAILVDDVFGLEILLDAKDKGYTTLQSTEISGIDHFEFEHGDEWQSWLEKVQPTFAKVLIRYNVDGEKSLNEKTTLNLKKLSDYTHQHGYKFLIEALVPATLVQLATVGGDKKKYDHALRPDLTARMIKELLMAGIEPDVWKIEGMYDTHDYQKVVEAARADGREHVGIVTLGRNETDYVVETWLKIGATVPGVIGFAVGRTIFLKALLAYRGGDYTREQAIDEISQRFIHFYNVFNG